MNKKGFFTMHPFMFFVVGLVIGIVLVYLIAKGIIPLKIGLCPTG